MWSWFWMLIAMACTVGFVKSVEQDDVFWAVWNGVAVVWCGYYACFPPKNRHWFLREKGKESD